MITPKRRVSSKRSSKEEVYLKQYRNFDEALENIAAFLEDVYNTKRLYSSLGYLPPVEFEEQYGAGLARTSKS